MRRIHLSLITLLATASLATGACGEKPKAKPTVPTHSTRSERTPEPSAPEPVQRTRGGVDLTAAVSGAGEARERIVGAAMLLAKDRAGGVAQLLAAKAASKGAVLALFESKNLDELIGAMLVLQDEADPTEARKDGMSHVLALLDHEVAAVRDVAWETASKVADGESLARLLPGATAERKLALIRLLAGWDGAPVQAALWDVVTGDDATLAIEAALALSTPGKRADATLTDKLATLIKDASEPRLRLALLIQRRAGDAKPAGLKDAIDRALLSQDEALVLEGIRATLAFPAGERGPLYEQLAADPRVAVRSVIAEVLVPHIDALAPAAQAAPIGLITKLLSDIEGDVRMAAARARSQVGPIADRKDALAKLLDEGHLGVRMAAAVSMAEPALIEGCAELLVKQVQREERDGRNTILGALASSKNRVGLLAIIGLLGDSDTNRVIAAHFALTTATGQDFVTDIGAWKAWVDKAYPAPVEPKPTAVPGKPE